MSRAEENSNDVLSRVRANPVNMKGRGEEEVEGEEEEEEEEEEKREKE